MSFWFAYTYTAILKNSPKALVIEREMFLVKYQQYQVHMKNGKRARKMLNEKSCGKIRNKNWFILYFIQHELFLT